MYSYLLHRMIYEEKGYRTELFSGSGMRNIHDVVSAELSMGNTDIIQFVQENYKILTDYCLDENELFDIKSNSKSKEDYDDSYFEAFSIMCQVNSDSIINELIEFSKIKLRVSNQTEIQLLWLATKEKVANLYNNQSLENIDEYQLINGDYFVISDLGSQGSLFVLKKNSENVGSLFIPKNNLMM